MPWLLNEDAALKFKLQGLQVIDANAPSGRNVPVRFRLPETEVADLTFPIIVIDHDGWYPAPEREHRGFTKLPYAPEGQQPWWYVTGDPSTESFYPDDSPYWSFFPIPYNLDYYVTVYTRIMHEHTIPLVSQLAAFDRLHPKFAFLDVPQDGTKRTLQLLGGPALTAEYDSNGKRFFQVRYKVRVFSELVPQVTTYANVTSINIDLSVYDDTTDLTGEGLSEAVGILSAGTTSAWNTNSLQ